jgi:hypothetical protein
LIKSVLGSRNFDNEVLRLIKGMPKWKPGQEKGKNVAVRFVLPIKFKLRVDLNQYVCFRLCTHLVQFRKSRVSGLNINSRGF